MIDIYKNSRTGNYDINISIDEWEDILRLPEIQNDKNILLSLEKWYLSPNCATSCKALSEQYGMHPNFFSVQNKRLGQFSVKYLNRFRLIGEAEKETFWGIACIELEKKNGLYIMQLRPELIKAIQTFGLFAKKRTKDRFSHPG